MEALLDNHAKLEKKVRELRKKEVEEIEKIVFIEPVSQIAGKECSEYRGCPHEGKEAYGNCYEKGASDCPFYTGM